MSKIPSVTFLLSLTIFLFFKVEPVVRPFNVSLMTLVLVVLVWQGLLVLHGQLGC